MAYNGTRKRGKSRLWFILHGWFALPVWGGLLLICITGTIATVSQEITWLYDSKVRAEPAHGPVNFTLVESTVKSNYPNSQINSIKIIAPYLALHLRLREADNKQRSILVNPYNGKIQKEVTGPGLRELILAIHGWLLIPWQEDYSIGWYVVTFFSIPFLGSLITALVIIKQYWRLFFQPKIRFNKGIRLFWSDIHRQIGVWSIWFASIMCITGLWFLFQGILEQNQIQLTPVPPTINVAAKNNHHLPTQTYIHHALEVYPDLHVTYINFPENKGEPVTVMGNRDRSIYRDNLNAIYMTPHSARVISFNSSMTTPFLQKIVGIMKPLHFGDFAGLPFKLVWFVFGCMLCFLIGSGFVIWTKKTVKSTQDIIFLFKNENRHNKKYLTTIAMNTLTWRGFRVLSWIVTIPPIIFLIQLLYQT